MIRTTVNQKTSLKLQSMRKTKTCRNTCNEFPMTLELCSGIIVLEAAAMLHDNDAEFAIIGFAHEGKRKRKNQTLFKKSTAVLVLWYPVPVTGLKKYRGTLVHGTSHLRRLHESGSICSFLKYR